MGRLAQFFAGLTGSPSPDPAFPVPRVRAETVAARTSPYEATSTRPRQSTAAAPDLGPSVVVEGNAARLRNMARDAYRNFSDFRAPVDAHVANLIGTGIKPVPKLSDPEQRRKLLALWDDFQERIDTRGALNFYQVQALAARALVVDGEAFVILRNRKPEDAPVPFQVQTLEADYLDFYNDPQRRIRQGVEFSPLDTPQAYHFLTRHPGERTLESAGSQADRKALPADMVCHVWKPERPGAVRGISRFAAAQVAVQQLASYADAYLRRMVISNAPSTFIESPADDGPFATDDDGNVIVETGQPVFLRPGQKVSHNAPPDLDANYEAYVRSVRRSICAAVGIPMELAFFDLGSLNERAMRVVTSEYRRACVADQWLLVRQLCDPVWRRFVETREARAITGEKFVGATWRPQGWEFFSPTADVAAKVAAIDAGLVSRTAVVAEMGDDVEDVDMERAADREREKQMGLTGPGKVEA